MMLLHVKCIYIYIFVWKESTFTVKSTFHNIHSSEQLYKWISTKKCRCGLEADHIIFIFCYAYETDLHPGSVSRNAIMSHMTSNAADFV